MTDINTALIALLGVLGGAYINNFVAEDFRRFRDSQALAGALAGELASTQVSLPDLLTKLKQMYEQARTGESLNLQEFPQLSSPIFEANTQKIGLLPPALAREVAFVYERVRSFQILFHHLSKHHVNMQIEGRDALILGCIGLVDGGENKIEMLVKSLDAHIQKKWLAPAARICLWLAAATGVVWGGVSIWPHLCDWAGPWVANVLGWI
jgi:hypothetical protein